MDFSSIESEATTQPVPLRVRSDSIPSSLKEAPRWVLWTYKGSEGKWSKPPQMSSGGNAKTNDPNTWTTFEEAMRAYETGKFSGIGFMLGDGLHGIDLDDCRNPETRELDERSQSILAVVDGYAEVSPSGTGIKIIASTTLERSKSEPQNGIELYTGNRFFCLTGHVLPDHEQISDDIQDATPILQLMKSNTFNDSPRSKHEDFLNQHANEWTLDRVKSELLPRLAGNDYASWLEVGMAMHQQGLGDPEWLDAWDEWSADFDDYEVGACANKWRSFGKGSGLKLGIATLIGKVKGRMNSRRNQDGSGLLPVLTIDQLNNLPAQRWLVKGLVPKTGMGVLYGESGAGKTFITLELLLTLARGVPWHGRRVNEPVGVLYVSAEGNSALRDRFQAYEKYHQVSLKDLPLRVVTAPVNLRSDDSRRVIEACRYLEDQGTPIGLIVFDTLNRTMGGGDENSPVDMGEYLDAISKITSLVNAFTLVIHHSGKNIAKGARGHSSLRAAMDLELEVKANGDQQILTVTKSRDGETGIEFAYKREIISLGLDEDLESIQSCVAVPGDPAQIIRNAQKPTGAIQQKVFEAVSSCSQGISRNALISKLTESEPKDSRKRESIQRAIQGCLEKLLIVQNDDLLLAH